jgi:hypothetical protein
MRAWFGVSVLGGMVALFSALIYQSAVQALPESDPDRLQPPPTAVIAGILLVVGIVTALLGLLGAGGALLRR